MSPIDEKSPDQGYWRSLEELGNTPEYCRFTEAEFPEEARVPTDAFSRRRFLQLMGASVAMAGAAGCRWPEEKIVPFAERPDGVVPGTVRRYATAMDLAGKVSPLLVTTNDGRPLKVEGNPDHPLSAGAADHFAQASVLEMYDPDRSREVLRRRGGSYDRRSWEDFIAWAGPHFETLRGNGGRGLAVLSEQSASPTLAALRRRLRDELPDAGWYEYEPVSRDNERLGSGLAFGTAQRAHLSLGAAAVIACFDADPLSDHPTSLRNARDFAEGRRAGHGRMNRLYAVESCPSVTGGMADHRFAVPTSRIPHVLHQLAAELFLHGGLELPRGMDRLRGAFAHVERQGHQETFVPALARDLTANRGRGLVVVGPRMPDHAHALCHLLNRALGNCGRTVTYSPEEPRGLTHGAAIADVAHGVGKGSIDTLLILGGNPAFDAPAELGLAELLARVPHSVRLGLYDDETSRTCAWHLPRAHYLESWGDVRDHDGRYGVVQPLISPLFGGWTAPELLSLLLDGEKRPAHAQVRETARGLGVRRDSAWKTLLRDGLLPGSEAAGGVPELEGRGLIAAVVRGAEEATGGNAEAARE
ncbi:TAT-variant-translocated molybdopterin oxidoreductase, partial [bacterium]|nr:TAT-variant-translocated molybdopterin oxidoreductase [bacterium]